MYNILCPSSRGERSRAQGWCMRKIFFFLAFLVQLLALPTFSQAGQAPLRVAVDSPYPPFAFENENGELTGFDVDVARALCAQLKRECSIVDFDFDEIIPAIVEGKLDIAIAGMGATEERRKLVDFTDSYFRSHSIFVEKHGNISTPDGKMTIQTLKGKKVGAQAGTLQEQYLRDTYGDAITIIAAESSDAAFDDLKKGATDILLLDGLAGYSYLKSPEGNGLETIGDPINPTGDGVFSRIVVSKKLPELREALNKGIKTLRRNGEYGKINRKYFDFDIY